MAREASENTPRHRPHLATWFSLNFRPLRWDEDILDRPDLIDVRGHFGIRFISSKYSSEYRPYVFYLRSKNFCGMCPRRFRDWADFLRNSKQDPRWEFIKRCTTLSEKTFLIAKENYGTFIPFSIDVAKYKKECGSDTRLNTAIEVDKMKTVKALRKEWARIGRSVKAGKDPATGKDIKDDD